MKRRWFLVMAVGVTLLALTTGASSPAQASSTNVAFVPSAGGQAGNGGSLPSIGFPGGYAPTFTDVSLASIRDDAVNPLTAFDTVVLAQVCDIGDYLAVAQFESRITSFVNAGGKLLIWDSECDATDYTDFVYPFTTSNPGAAGANGTLTISENDALGSSDPASPQFVDANLIATGTDAVGDANIFTTKDASWCVQSVGTNILGVNGPVVNYAKLGAGLIVYTGLDYDAITDGSSGYDPASTDPSVQLGRVWLNQLQADPTSNLPCGVLAFGITLNPPTASVLVGQSHTLTASVFSGGNPVAGAVVTFTVGSGPNAGRTGTATTDAAGLATFTYTSAGVGTDSVTASGVIDTTNVVSAAVAVTWTAPPPPAPVPVNPVLAG